MTDNGYTDIDVRSENGVVHIILNRPDRLNAIRINTYRELIEALRQADDSDSCQVILLSGQGKNFTAGNDLQDLLDAEADQVMEGVQGIFDCVASLKKVLVAAVEGVAVGIGTTLLLHCDIVVAARTARFRLPFVNLGVSPEGGSSRLLARAVGEKAARELLLTGRFFSAEEAMSWGLLSGLAEPGEAETGAREYIQALLRQPLESLVATKELMRAPTTEVGDVVAAELEVFSRLLQNEHTKKRISSLIRG
ncbi:MAG TPA: enoyl-CoA hydratase-related protein [Desulfopila sp.]|nr:enoyl-CoA hydratase-related protein [Desulfopila sp.]